MEMLTSTSVARESASGGRGDSHRDPWARCADPVALFPTGRWVASLRGLPGWYQVEFVLDDAVRVKLLDIYRE